MDFMHHLPENLQHLMDLASPEMTSMQDDPSNEDNFGVGAVMPQDMPEYMFLAEPEAYGV